MCRDNYDMQMLKAIQKIAKNLEIIARHLEPNVETEKPRKTDGLINPFQE